MVQGFRIDPEEEEEVFIVPYSFISHHITTPAVLQVCQASRKVALKPYSLAFDTSFERKEGLATITIATPARIYVNWECDVISPSFPPPPMLPDFNYDIFEMAYTLTADGMKIRRIEMQADMYQEASVVMHTRSLEDIMLYTKRDSFNDHDFMREAPFKLIFTNLVDSVDGQIERVREVSREMQKLAEVAISLKNDAEGTLSRLSPKERGSRAISKISLMKLEVQEGQFY